MKTCSKACKLTRPPCVSALGSLGGPSPLRSAQKGVHTHAIMHARMHALMHALALTRTLTHVHTYACRFNKQHYEWTDAQPWQVRSHGSAKICTQITGPPPHPLGLCRSFVLVACVHACMRVCVYASVRASVCMCACVHVCMCACVHVCMCACLWCT